jgi:hypothetical protein
MIGRILYWARRLTSTSTNANGAEKPFTYRRDPMSGFGEQVGGFYPHPTLIGIKQVDVVQGGGWIYQFSNTYGVLGYAFVPNMGLWAAAFAAAQIAATNANVASKIGLDLSHPSDKVQQPPKE